ncbi:MAG: biotin/lipoyl-containing protein, partial [Burkholderiaceae bacterium]
MATVELKVPDIGDFKEVEIIEVLVKPGDSISVEQSLITVESDKASMEIPASIAGTIVELKVKLGDKVSEGSVVALIEAAGAGAPASASTGTATAESARSELKEGSSGAPSSGGAAGQQGAPAHVSPVDPSNIVKPHASPAVRMFARELG